VWGRESYRRSVIEGGESLSYYLWAPDEIRSMFSAWAMPMSIGLKIEHFVTCLLHS